MFYPAPLFKIYLVTPLKYDKHFVPLTSLYCFIMSLFAAAKYDAEKEAKENRESKEKQLAKIEEARKKANVDKCMLLHCVLILYDRLLKPTTFQVHVTGYAHVHIYIRTHACTCTYTCSLLL